MDKQEYIGLLSDFANKYDKFTETVKHADEYDSFIKRFNSMDAKDYIEVDEYNEFAEDREIIERTTKIMDEAQRNYDDNVPAYEMKKQNAEEDLQKAQSVYDTEVVQGKLSFNIAIVALLASIVTIAGGVVVTLLASYPNYEQIGAVTSIAFIIGFIAFAYIIKRGIIDTFLNKSPFRNPAKTALKINQKNKDQSVAEYEGAVKQFTPPLEEAQSAVNDMNAYISKYTIPKAEGLKSEHVAEKTNQLLKITSVYEQQYNELVDMCKRNEDYLPSEQDWGLAHYMLDYVQRGYADTKKEALRWCVEREDFKDIKMGMAAQYQMMEQVNTSILDASDRLANLQSDAIAVAHQQLGQMADISNNQSKQMELTELQTAAVRAQTAATQDMNRKLDGVENTIREGGRYYERMNRYMDKQGNRYR